MELDEFLEFLVLVKVKDREERVFQQWCAMLPQMAKYMAYEEFKDFLTGANIDRRSTAEIVADIEQAHGMKKGELYGNI